MSTMIRMEEIVKEYGKGGSRTKALKGISLQIEKGEFVVVTGASGCGKSTLLNIMGGMDRQTGGVYYYDEMPVTGLTEKELARFRNRNIGFVFQSFHLAKELTAVENVELPLGYAGIGGRERRKRATALLERVGLLEKCKSHPSKLSGGEMQRVAIARALANSPQTLLADEPTGNLDHKNGRAVMDLLRELNKEGTTVVMVTHDRELADMADRKICIADGNIVSF